MNGADDDDEIILFEGELWNGSPTELSLGDVTLTAQTLHNIILQRLDRFAVEEIHLCDVSFENNQVFEDLVMALQDLDSLERLTWHSALTLTQWNVLVVGWEAGQLTDLDIVWKVWEPPVAELDDQDSDDSDGENDDEGLEDAFSGFVWMSSETLVVRMEEYGALSDSDNILRALDTGRREKRLQQVTDGDDENDTLAISVHVWYQDSQTFASWAKQIASYPGALSSLKLEETEFNIESLPLLSQIVRKGDLINLTLMDCSVSTSSPTAALTSLKTAFHENTSLQRLAFRSIEDPGHPLWSSLFDALCENTGIEHLQLTTENLEDLPDLLVPMMPYLPHMHGLRALQTQWCAGLGDVLLPGLKASLYLHHVILDDVANETPTEEEAATIHGILDRNRLYHEMKFVSYDDNDLFETLEFLAQDDLGRSGTALYSIIRGTLLPHLLVAADICSKQNKRQRRSSCG